MLVLCFWLKLHVQVGLKALIFVERVDPDIGNAAGAERLTRAAEIAEDAERDLANLESEFRRHFQNEQAVDPNLVRRHRSGVREPLLPANVEGVKAVAVAAVRVEDRRDLEINVLREIELRADLPREEPGVGVRHQPAAGDSPGSERVLRIRI